MSITLSDEQLSILELMLQIMSPISVATGVFTVLTFTVFQERRRIASWALNVLFMTSATLVDLLLLIGGFFGLKYLADPANIVFCKAQGVLLMLFGSAMIIFFFLITVHLYMRLCITSIEANGKLLVTFGLVLPVIMTIPPLVADKFAYDGVWCFIANDEPLFLYLNFYGPMGFACVLGMFMWASIIIHMYRRPSNRAVSVSVNGDKHYSAVVTRLDPVVEAQQKAEQQERWHLVLRQLLFVTLFEAIFFTFFANRIYTSVTAESSFGGWIFHTFAMCACGCFCFIIFGLKQSNFELWYFTIGQALGFKVYDRM